MRALLALALLLAATGCEKDKPPASGETGASREVPSQVEPEDQKARVVADAEVELRVLGMTWPEDCPRRVRDLIEKLPGVASAEVSYDKENAVVRYDSKAIEPPAIVKVLETSGYKSWETRGENQR